MAVVPLILLISAAVLAVFVLGPRARGNRQAERAPFPGIEANICLRNARLWTAQAQQFDRSQQPRALLAAQQWTQAYDEQMRLSPAQGPVPVRPGDPDPAYPTWQYYTYAVVVLGSLAVGMIVLVVRLVLR